MDLKKDSFGWVIGEWYYTKENKKKKFKSNLVLSPDVGKHWGQEE